MILLDADDLAVGYGRTIVARHISLTLEAGSVTGLLGPNGIGKTTLFKTLLGLLPALGGTIRLGGADLALLTRPAIARQIAYVPQAYASEFSYTILDLVVMGRTTYLSGFGTPAAQDFDIAMEALESLGIAGLAERDATRVSGGQRQLALVARALAQKTALIFMDEPTANLDLGNRILVLDRIRDLAAKGLAVLISTHEPEQAFALCDHVAILGPHSFETGPVHDVLTAQKLSMIYSVDLIVEETPSGRRVVSAARKDAAEVTARND